VNIPIKYLADTKDDCNSFRDLLIGVIEAERRFIPQKKGSSDFIFRITCAEKKVGGVFFIARNLKTPLVVASYWTTIPDIEAITVESFAKEFWSKVRDRLPWSAEVIGLTKSAVPADYGENSGGLYPRGKGVVTFGINANSLIGSCVPVEVGVLKPVKGQANAEFLLQYPAVIKQVDLDQSKIEIYTKEDSIPLDELYVMRLGDPSSLPDGFAEVLKYCHAHPNAGEPKKITELFAEVFGKDPIEVNNVLQRYGASIFSLRASNGSWSQPMVGGYIHNRLLFGDFFLVDGFGIRHIYSKPYHPRKGGAYDTPPESTTGELFVGGRARIRRFNFFVGTGLILEKNNVPYDFPLDQGGYSNNRMSSARFGLMVGGSYAFRRLNCAFRLPIAQTQGRVYVDFHNYCSYRLSSTWLAGADVLMIRSEAKEKYAPSINMYALGGFLGVEVGR
jgi:hypothetical protein